MREPPRDIDFDSALGRQVVELHVWAVSEGLRGVAADALFDGFCQRLVIAGIPLWRGYAAMNTLHPQWGGYSYTWRRDLNAIEPEQFERTLYRRRSWFDSPFAYLLSELNAFSEEANPWQHLRRRLAGPEAKLDFPILEEFAAAGATDYFAEIVRFGADGDPSRGIGVGYSFTSDRPQGFREDDLQLLKAVLPALSLALMTHAGHTIASGLLQAYLGGDAGRPRFRREHPRRAVVRRYPQLYCDRRHDARSPGHRAAQRGLRDDHRTAAPRRRPGAEIHG
jgi:adenylate cyclase